MEGEEGKDKEEGKWNQTNAVTWKIKKIKRQEEGLILTHSPGAPSSQDRTAAFLLAPHTFQETSLHFLAAPCLVTRGLPASIPLSWQPLQTQLLLSSLYKPQVLIRELKTHDVLTAEVRFWSKMGSPEIGLEL